MKDPDIVDREENCQDQVRPMPDLLCSSKLGGCLGLVVG